MSFSAHRSGMAQIVSTIRDTHEAPYPFMIIVADSLEHLTNHEELFNTSISNSPCVEHFFNQLRAFPAEDEAGFYFGLFEDIAIFFREKTLKTKRIMETERRVLELFETADEWQPQDGTLVSHWYWEKLPNLAAAPTSTG